MMEFLQFTFQSFWHFAGMVVLVTLMLQFVGVLIAAIGAGLTKWK